MVGDIASKAKNSNLNAYSTKNRIKTKYNASLGHFFGDFLDSPDHTHDQLKGKKLTGQNKHMELTGASPGQYRATQAKKGQQQMSA